MSTKPRAIKIEITHKTIFFVFFVIGAILFLSTIKDIIISLFIAMVIATAVYPLVKWLERFRIPRVLSAALILILVFVLLILLIVSLVPLFIGQVTTFLSRLPDLLERFPWLKVDSFEFTSFLPQVSSISGNLVRAALDTFSASLFLVTTLFISFYMVIERDNLDDYLNSIFGAKKDEIERVIFALETKLGHWVRGQLLLMIIVGVMTYLGLIVIGLDYALPLAIIAGLMEAIPNLGPTVASIPAIIVGFAMSPFHGILAIILYVLVQQLENNLIVPQVMRKSIGLHPVITIVALMIGFRLGGAVLAVLSLPLVLVIQTLWNEIYRRKISV